jgi:hypothetical protein
MQFNGCDPFFFFINYTFKIHICLLCNDGNKRVLFEIQLAVYEQVDCDFIFNLIIVNTELMTVCKKLSCPTIHFKNSYYFWIISNRLDDLIRIQGAAEGYIFLPN